MFSKQTKFVTAFVGIILLGGCQTMMDLAGVELKSSVKNVDTFCLVARPITWDRHKDTPETAEQIVEHNAVGKRLCGWKPNHEPPA